MYVCMHVCIYIYMYVYMYTNSSTCMQKRVCVYIYMNIYIHTHIGANLERTAIVNFQPLLDPSRAHNACGPFALMIRSNDQARQWPS